MAKISVDDHLDDLLERLTKEEFQPNELENLLKVSKVVVEIAKVKTNEKRLQLDQVKVLDKLGFRTVEKAMEIQKQLMPSK